MPTFHLPLQCVPATSDFSSLFEPILVPLWATVQPWSVLDLRQFGGGAHGTALISSGSGVGGDDLQALASELLHEHGSPSLPISYASPSPSS